MELRKSGYIKETVYNWIETRIAHGKPVGTEEEDIDVLPAIDVGSHLIQEEVGFKWKPAKRETSYDNYQHVNDLAIAVLHGASNCSCWRNRRPDLECCIVKGYWKYFDSNHDVSCVKDNHRNKVMDNGQIDIVAFPPISIRINWTALKWGKWERRKRKT